MVPGREQPRVPTRCQLCRAGAYSHPERRAVNASIDCAGWRVRHTPGHLIESVSEQALSMGSPGSDTHLSALCTGGEGQCRFWGEGCTAHCAGCQMWPVVRAGAGSRGRRCLGCIIGSSSVSSSHLKALCSRDYCSFWLRDEMHREPQVPQPAHGGAGSRPWSAVTREETTLTPDGCPLPPQCRARGLLHCLNHWRQMFPCFLQAVFPAILF